MGLTGEPFRDFERFEDGGAVGLAATEVVNLASLRCGHKRGHETGDVEGVDIIANLFTLVSKDLILPSFQVAFDEIGQKAVQLDAGMVRTGEANRPLRTAWRVMRQEFLPRDQVLRELSSQH